MSALLLVVVGFAIHRFRSSFGDQPPAWARIEEVSSPKLPAELVDQLSAFRKELDSESKATGLPLQSMQFAEVVPGGKEIRVWRLEQLTNPGPGPLDRLEIPRTLTDSQVAGFYSLDGTPLNFLLRHQPTHPKAAVGVIKFDPPIAAGVTVSLIGIEHQPHALKTNAAGEFTYQFNRLRNSDNSIQVVGVILPSSYSLLRYTPTTGAFTAANGTPFVAWINTRIETGSPPPSVAFKPM